MANIEELLQTIEKMNVLELSELVKALETKFGVSAAPMAMAMAGGAAAGDAPKAAEQTSFGVHLNAAGDKKIQVVKIVREITGLGLAESKALVDGAPKAVKDGVSKEEAEAIKAKFDGSGATIEIK